MHVLIGKDNLLAHKQFFFFPCKATPKWGDFPKVEWWLWRGMYTFKSLGDFALKSKKEILKKQWWKLDTATSESTE